MRQIRGGWVFLWLMLGMSVGVGVAQDLPSAVAESSPKQTLKFGVFNYLGDAQTYAKYAPIVDYLNHALVHEHIELEVLSHDEMDRRIAEGTLDLATTNPTHFLHIRRSNHVDGVMASLVSVQDGVYLPYLAGVILVLNQREDIRSLSDIRGKRIATPGGHLLGGYQTQVFELLQEGIQVPRDVAEVRAVGTHQDVVRAVLDGSVDVGFLRSGILEMMEASGALLPGDVRVINPQTTANFPYQHSTRLYPEWPVFSMPHVNEHAVRHVASALFSLESDNPAAKQAEIYGYSVPRDYLQVEELSRTLRLPPFNQTPEFTALDVLVRWKYGLIGTSVALLIIFFLSFRLLVVWRREHDLRQFNQLVLTSLGQGVYNVDLQCCCRFINPSALEILEITEHEVLGQSPHMLFQHHDADGNPITYQDGTVWKTLQDGRVRKSEEWFIRSNGVGFSAEVLVTPMMKGNDIVGAAVIFSDITERKHMEAQLIELATTDALTGLSNRRFFLSKLIDEVVRVKRFASPACVVMLDCDYFKQVNDRYGHAVGDEVLCGLAEIMRSNLRQTDDVGRLGGEEFAVLLKETALDAAMLWAERVRAAVAERLYHAAGKDFVVTVSLGCALIQADDDENSVLARADQALYQAKQNGRNRVESV